MNLIIYRILIIILTPIIHLYLFIRKLKGKEHKSRFNERFGKTQLERPNGKLIWINAVSVGEINSAWTIIKRLNEENEYKLLITTTSTTSAENVKNKIKQLPNIDNVIHQFAPIDTYFSVKRFLKHWKPDILINVESEFWPNLFTLTKKFCPIMVLNGKMSKKSFRFWYRNKKLKESIFDSIDICLAQSRNDYKRFIMLGVQNVQFLGNIKFFVDKCYINGNLYEKLLEQTKNRRKWLVNCTHRGEEEIIIGAHKLLKQKHKNLLTMLIIRHTNRTEEVLKLLEKHNLKYITTTSGENIADDTDFYVYNMMGELGTFFELNDIVFIAGSLQRNIGGHTPAEAIKHNCCVITGPYVENNYMLFKDLLNEKACIMIKDTKPETLFETVNDLFNDNVKVKAIVDASYRKGLQSSVVLNEIVGIIKSRVC